MKKWFFVLPTLIALMLLSCTPREAPAPVTATPIVSNAPSSTPSSVIPKVSPEDAEWQKVVVAAQKEGKATLYTWGY
ncbi:MAG: hypothetical protein HW399_903, partial [Dehalococcoidia bacterium]|nr:hypothetical protein [Dehalococcoidia bacterium]